MYVPVCLFFFYVPGILFLVFCVFCKQSCAYMHVYKYENTHASAHTQNHSHECIQAHK